jgi:hypothetical protein
MFITGRALAGTGGAGLILGLLTVLAASAPLDKRPSKASSRILTLNPDFCSL